MRRGEQNGDDTLEMINGKTYPIAKVLAFSVRFVRRAEWRGTVERVRYGGGADVGVGIPVYHIRSRGVLVKCTTTGATYGEALPGGRQWGHSSSHHHRGTLRSVLRPASFIHHYARYWNHQGRVNRDYIALLSDEDLCRTSQFSRSI